MPLSNSIQGAASNRLLFVASGGCYGGGVTLSTASNTVSAFNTSTGAFDHLVVDYGVYSPGDSPVAVSEYDSNRLLILVENASGRRIDIVNKDGSGLSTYISNSTALSAVGRAMAFASDGSILVSKSSAIEKFNSAKSRILQGANPYVSAPAGSCATSTTLISDVALLSNNKILYTHAAATPNNRIGLISATGYSSAADCLAGTAAPATTALPTAVVVHPSGKTLVSFGSTTSASNFIYSYDVSATANTITNATQAFFDSSIVNGPSAMTIDSSTGDVFVANATSTFNTIELFRLSGSTLSRPLSRPLIGPNVYTRCIAGMKVMDYNP
ncbi:MAG: hypothetical protein AB7H97_20575 [Pseudobdellovibrionaceae bacterium]